MTSCNISRDCRPPEWHQRVATCNSWVDDIQCDAECLRLARLDRDFARTSHWTWSLSCTGGWRSWQDGAQYSSNFAGRGGRRCDCRTRACISAMQICQPSPARATTSAHPSPAAVCAARASAHSVHCQSPCTAAADGQAPAGASAGSAPGAGATSTPSQPALEQHTPCAAAVGRLFAMYCGVQPLYKYHQPIQLQTSATPMNIPGGPGNKTFIPEHDSHLWDAVRSTRS